MTEREIFVAALHLHDSAERAAFLDRACGEDRALRARVEELLREQEQLGSFLEQPAAAEGPTGDVASGQWIDPGSLPRVSEGPGSRIGPYKLLQQIGEGGMGVVY